MNKTGMILGGALFLSLAGNLFMGGYMLGHKAMPPQGPHIAQGGPEGREARRAEWKKRDEQLRRKLSDADRKVFEEIKAGSKDRIDALRQALDAAHDRVETAQNADPFDRAALEQALQQETVAKAEFLATIKSMRKEIAAKLSPEGREAMEKLRPPKKAREGRGPRGEGRRGEFMQRWKDRQDGARPDFPPDEVAPPRHDNAPPPEGGPDDSGNQPPPPPKGDNCGGCEVPGDMPEGAAPQP